MAIDFDGSTQYLHKTDATGFTAFPTSMCCWVYADTITTSMAAMGLGSSTNQWLVMRYRGDATWKNFEAGVFNGGSSHAMASHGFINIHSAITASTWYLMIGIFSGTFNGSAEIELYAGHENSMFGSPHVIAYPSISILRVGATPLATPGGFWDGRLAHIAVWRNYRLTIQDIHRLVQGARPDTIAKASLYDYWRLNGTADTTAGNQTGVNGNVLTAVASPVHKAGPTGLDSYATIGQSLTGLANGTYSASIYNHAERKLATRLVWHGDIVVSGGTSSTQVTTALGNGAPAYAVITNQTASQTDQGRNTIAGPLVLNHAA